MRHLLPAVVISLFLNMAGRCVYLSDPSGDCCTSRTPRIIVLLKMELPSLSDKLELLDRERLYADN